MRIVVRDDQGRLLLVRQYRHPIGRYTWEVPAGGVEPSEDLLVAAQRELYEETGVGAGRWRQLGNVVSLPNATNFEAGVFLATDLLAMPPRGDSAEMTEVSESKFFDADQLRDLILSGDLCDDKSLAALHLETMSGTAMHQRVDAPRHGVNR
ncbi:NUDIX hydrolase [Plantibacter elymi (nom. nud.)]|uniref:NUDIX hydrolase n=1 Tax=Plantibacter elymi (nom. nud.) TaxID=199708 RepID=UPI0013FDD90D|nr:NUDIX hydrolase [Plantibacter sp. VKM Ac-1784]